MGEDATMKLEGEAAGRRRESGRSPGTWPQMLFDGVQPVTETEIEPPEPRPFTPEDIDKILQYDWNTLEAKDPTTTDADPDAVTKKSLSSGEEEPRSPSREPVPVTRRSTRSSRS